MTINIADNSPRISYSVAEGVTQTSFAVPFEFFNDSDLNVYLDGTLQTITTNYTVAGGDGSTGTITMSVTGASGGSTVVITRDIELERTTDFPVSGAFNIVALNTELDRLVAIAADLEDRAARAIQAQDFDSTVSYTLPLVDDRKGKVLGFNATTGAVEAGPEIADTQSLANISADIALLADIEDGTLDTNAITNVNGIRTDVTTVSGISANVTTVANNDANVTTVATNDADITTVATNIASVNTVATNIADVITVANDLNEAISEVETVANDLNEAVSEIDTVASSITNVDLVGNSVTNVNTVAGSISNVNTTATNISNVNTVAGINTDVTTVAGISSDVTTVAADGTDIGTVAGISSNVSTVAGISGNVTTVAGISSNVTTVAGISSDVTAVAGDATDIGTVASNLSSTDTIGTVAGSISNVNIVAGDISNVNSVATNQTNIDAVASNATNINAVAADATDIGVVSTNIANVNTVAGISANVTTVATIQADVTTVAADQTDIGTVSTNIANVNTVAGVSGNVTTVAGISSDVTTVSGISANVTTVAGDTTNIGTIATNLTGTNTIGTVATNIGNVNTVGNNISDVNAVAANNTNINTVATDLSGSDNIGTVSNSISNVNSVGNSITNVNTVASNLSAVNSFANQYRIGSADPTTSLDTGDLFYNTTSGTLKVYTGSAWEQGVTAGSGFLALSGGTLTGDLFGTNATLSGYLRGPSSFTIDPAAHGDNTGTVIIAGNLQVDGSTTTINSTTLTVDDLNMTLASGAASAAAANGAGLTVDGASATITYNASGDTWDFNKGLSVPSMTTTGNINFGDNDRAVFGAGSDLQIYHSNTASFIDDVGTGNLNIRAENLNLQNSTGAENYIRMNHNGSVDVYYDNSKKLETTSSGINVTGTITADENVTIQGSTPRFTVQDTDGTSQLSLLQQQGSDFFIRARNNTVDGRIVFAGYGGSSTTNRLDITSGGDVRFWDETGAATKLVWDTSEEALEFGDNVKATFGASADLQIYHTGSTSYIFEQGTGDLRIRGNQVRIEDGDGSTIALFQNDAGAQLRHNGTVVLDTTSTGIDVTGNVSATGGIYADTLMQIDNTTGFGKIEVGGASGAFIDLKTPASDDYDGRIYYDGSQLYITAANNQPTQLRHDNNTKLATTSTGINVTGTLNATAFTGDGSGLTGIGFTTNVVTSNTTASKNNHYYLNAASVTLTLPASPSVGDEVRISEVAGNTNCVIGRNGSNIMGDASDLTIDTAYLVLSLRYVDATIGWAFS